MFECSVLEAAADVERGRLEGAVRVRGESVKDKADETLICFYPCPSVPIREPIRFWTCAFVNDPLRFKVLKILEIGLDDRATGRRFEHRVLCTGSV